MTTIMVGKNYRIEQCMKCRHCDDFIECKHYEKTGTKCEYYEFPINNSKWSFIRLFLFKGRIGRTEMWLSYLGCFSSAILVNIYFVENAVSTSLRQSQPASATLRNIFEKAFGRCLEI